MRGNSQLVEVFRGQTLNPSSVTRFSTQFPLGEGWFRLMLRFGINLTIGTGAGPVSEGELLVIKGITFKTSRGEIPYNNVPGRMLWYLDDFDLGTPGQKDAIAAATGLYYVPLTLWFADPLMGRPQDTILDTSRYSAVTLEFNLGTISDFMGTPGTATATYTLDAYLDRQRGPIPKNVRPKFFQEIGVRAPLNPNNGTLIDLERAANMAYKRLLLHQATSATAGVPFSGTSANSQITDTTLDHDGDQPFNTVLWAMQERVNKAEFSLESLATGWLAYNLAKDGSMQSALYSGDKSRLRVMWTNGTLGASPQLTLGYVGYRPLQ